MNRKLQWGIWLERIMEMGWSRSWEDMKTRILNKYIPNCPTFSSLLQIPVLQLSTFVWFPYWLLQEPPCACNTWTFPDPAAASYPLHLHLPRPLPLNKTTWLEVHRSFPTTIRIYVPSGIFLEKILIRCHQIKTRQPRQNECNLYVHLHFGKKKITARLIKLTELRLMENKNRKLVFIYTIALLLKPEFITHVSLSMKGCHLELQQSVWQRCSCCMFHLPLAPPIFQ